MHCFCDGEIIDIHNLWCCPRLPVKGNRRRTDRKNAKIVKVMKVVSVAMRVFAERVRGV